MSDDRLKAVWFAPLNEHGEQMASDFNVFGQELPDPVPVAVPFNPAGSMSLRDEIRAVILSEALRDAAHASGFDTPEEADDLDVPDDPIDPLTPWEAEYEASQERLASRKASLGSSLSPLTATTVERPIAAPAEAVEAVGKGIDSKTGVSVERSDSGSSPSPGQSSPRKST